MVGVRFLGVSRNEVRLGSVIRCVTIASHHRREMVSSQKRNGLITEEKWSHHRRAMVSSKKKNGLISGHGRKFLVCGAQNCSYDLFASSANFAPTKGVVSKPFGRSGAFGAGTSVKREYGGTAVRHLGNEVLRRQSCVTRPGRGRSRPGTRPCQTQG